MMNIYEADEILNLIVAEFPQQRKKITELFNESSNFIEICEDYVICLDSLKKLENNKDQKRERELSELKWALSELKQELLSRI